MRTLSKILLLFIILSFGSCVKYPTEVINKYTFVNNSEHNIKITFVPSNWAVVDSISIPINNEITILVSTPEEDSFIFASVETAHVMFDDTLLITHERNNFFITVSRPLLIYYFWYIVQLENNALDFEYVFTNEDYLEAIENQF